MPAQHVEPIANVERFGSGRALESSDVRGRETHRTEEQISDRQRNRHRGPWKRAAETDRVEVHDHPGAVVSATEPDVVEL